MVKGKLQGYEVKDAGKKLLCCQILTTGICLLQHRLEVISDLEGGIGLSLDLIDSYAVGDLDECKTVSEVDVKDALQTTVSNPNSKEFQT